MTSERDPDRRTMPTPPGPDAVAMAAMVSRVGRVMRIWSQKARKLALQARATCTSEALSCPATPKPASRRASEAGSSQRSSDLDRLLAVALDHPPLLQQ